MEQSTTRVNQFQQSVFLDYFQVLRRRKWMVLLCLIGVVIPVSLWTYFSIPLYEAEATIIYEEPKDTMFALDIGQPFYNKSAMINMIEQIMSRRLAEEVAQVLPQQIIQTFKFPDRLTSNFSQHKFIVQYLKKNISVVSVRGSDILKIKVQANDPFAAKIITNTYVERLINWNLQKKREEITSIRDFVEKQLTVFQDKLNAAEETLKVFKEENKLISLSDASTEILSRITGAEVAYNQVKTEREALEQRMHYVNQKIQELAPSITLTYSPEAQQLKQQLMKFETQYSSTQLQDDISENHPEILSLKQKISQLKKELSQELLKTAQQEILIDPLSHIRNLLQEAIALELDLEAYKVREMEMKKIMDNYNIELQILPKQELQLARFLRDKEVNDKIYSMLLEKREEARITEASKIGDIHIIDVAEEQMSPIKPRKKRNLALAFMLGLSLGVGLVFFLESLDTSLRSQEDVEQHLNSPVLASIPTIHLNNVFHFVKKNPQSKECYSNKLLLHFPDDHLPYFYEAYRTLQLNFAFVNTDNVLKSFLVSSPGIGEGKTMTTINIAQLFAKTGTKTLLIDCDLRRPMVHKALNLKQEPGLTDILINNVADPHSSIQKTEKIKFSVLSCGILPPNPSEILNSQKMKNILVEMKKKYELVILDGTPLLAVTDSIVLGTEVDGVVLVVRSGKTNQKAALRAKQILESRGIKIFGIILNDVNLKSVYGYYKDYYYYSNKKKRLSKT
ncbi:MAG: GumC family protein [Candidatus Hodarchaeota archaeon]